MTVPDTTDLRAGVPLHDALLGLLPLVGVWEGTGRGVVPSSGAEFGYRQRISFAPDGRPFLAYESRSGLVDEDGAVLRNALRETGYWRPGAGEDETVRLRMRHADGRTLVVEGILTHLLADPTVGGFVLTVRDLQWDLGASTLLQAPTAREVAGERRFYALVDGALGYATELAVAEADYLPHLNARLTRV